MIDENGAAMLYEVRYRSKYDADGSYPLRRRCFKSISEFKRFIKDHCPKFFTKEQYQTELKKMKAFFGTTESKG